MERKFNTKGICVPEKHYMVDLTERVRLIEHEYIEPGEYFVINRARQYGKTTTLSLLANHLSDDYLLVKTSFEGKEEYFVSRSIMVGGLFRIFRETLKNKEPRLAAIFEPEVNEIYPMDDLETRITELCKKSDKYVVLMIDEIDKAADFDVFVTFLGKLRDMYIVREMDGKPAIKSVILAGVTDIKNLKSKIRDEKEGQSNSPWNIAADFNIDMSFSEEQIAGMLSEYEADHHTGMDVQALAYVLRDQTSGYPFLVSAICKHIDEVSHDWTITGVHAAIAIMIYRSTTLFDSIVVKLNNNPEFRAMIEAMLLQGARIIYTKTDSRISTGLMFGILKDNGAEVGVSNKIFETVIYNHLASEQRTDFTDTDVRLSTLYLHDGRLDIEALLDGFATHAKAVSNKKIKMNETLWKYRFLDHLRGAVNGTGHFSVESETRDGKRIDVKVYYKLDEFIVELKIWHGEKKERDAYDQLANYMMGESKNRGYLVSFCGLRTPPERGKWISYNGVRIYEVVVEY